MANLIPISSIPYCAREAKARERAKWPTRAMALDAATYEIVDAPGTFSGAFPRTVGWILTRAAAKATRGYWCRMPGGTPHRMWAYREHAVIGKAKGRTP